ncbi:MAG: hypothetical protein Q9170_001547 [Blastenia crenularia]
MFSPLALTSIAITLLTHLSSPVAAANGINCKGSSDCSFTSQNNMGQMVGLINGMPDDKCVKAGDKIACITAGIASICAFPQQNTGTVCGAKLKKLANGLNAHGCTNCGSIPFDSLTGGNNDHLGELTVNAVLGSCFPSNQEKQTGLCPGI